MGEKGFTGTLTLGHNIMIGYFAQNQASLLDEEITVFQTVDEAAKGDIRTKIRDILGDNPGQAGIYISSGSTNTKIRNNKIHDWYYNGTTHWGCWGIFYNAEAISTTEIFNNLIYNIKSDGYLPGVHSDNPYGIYVQSGGNLKIYHNTIYLSGNVLSSTAEVWSACIGINSGCSSIDILNNILKNSMQPVSGNFPSKTFAIINGNPAGIFTNINNNDYYVNGIGPNIGYQDQIRPTLASWQAATGQDNASVNNDPLFTSETNLIPTSVPLIHKGVYLTAVPTDITNISRSNPPDVGAYEYATDPIVNTTAASGITSFAATLNGTINANSLTVGSSFEYGLTTTYGSTVAGLPATVTGNVVTPATGTITGLIPNTLYHYRIIGTSITAGAGTNTIIVTFGSVSGNVTVAGTGTCGNGIASSLSVTVNPQPVPTITGLASSCVNTTSNVYSTQAGMTGYTWTVSAGGTITAGSGTSAITVTWSTPGAKTVTVNYTNASNCAASVPASFAVTVNPTPLPAIGSTNNPCIGSTNNIYYTESGMTGYVWTVSTGGTIVSGQGTALLNVTWTQIGPQTVSVTYTNTTGCPAMVPGVYSVFVNSPPTTAGAISGTASVCAGTNGVIYQFHRLLVPLHIHGLFLQAHPSLQVQEPAVSWLTSALRLFQEMVNGCSSPISNKVWLVVTGQPEFQNSIISVYPVPNTGLFTISIESASPESCTISIYNNLGVNICEMKDIKVNGRFEQVVDLKDAVSGIYTIIFRNPEKLIVKKMIVLD